MITKKIDGFNFILDKDNVLRVETLTVKKDRLVVEWHKACMQRGCKLTTLFKANSFFRN